MLYGSKRIASINWQVFDAIRHYMNVVVPFPISLFDAHDEATTEVCRWRGHCIDLYAKIELACVDALEKMIDSKRLQDLRRQSLFGARFAELRKGLESGKFGKNAKALKALNELTAPLARRNDISHGVGTVWIDGNGNWLWQFVYRNNSSKEAEVSGFVSSIEAAQMEKFLSKKAQSFVDLLRNLNKEITEAVVTE